MTIYLSLSDTTILTISIGKYMEVAKQGFTHGGQSLFRHKDAEDAKMMTTPLDCLGA